MMWTYNGTVLHTAPEQQQGFVYLITNTANGKKYIGKKNFWTVKKLPPLKGKKNKRHRRVETDWQTYYGSSTALQADINSQGVDDFTRQILYLCATKTWMAYHETRLQFEYGVLGSDDYYNDFISCRINSSGLKKRAP